MKPTSLDNPENKKRLVNTNGMILEVVENANYDDGSQIKGMPSFYEWLGSYPVLPTLQQCWAYKSGEILAITEDWEQSVLFGKEQLKTAIDSVLELNKDLEARIKVLEGQNAQLLKEIDSLSPSVQNNI